MSLLCHLLRHERRLAARREEISVFLKAIEEDDKKRSSRHLLESTEQQGQQDKQEGFQDQMKGLMKKVVREMPWNEKKIEDEMEMTPEISYIVNFIRESARGIIPAGK